MDTDDGKSGGDENDEQDARPPQHRTPAAASSTSNSFTALPSASGASSTSSKRPSVVVAQGSQRRNGVVEWRVTLVGQTANFSQSLSTEALLVLVVDDVIMMEDQDRDTRLFHLSQLLQTQTAPCAVKLRFAGDVQAQTTLSELDFSFDYSSYSGNTSILVTAIRPGCHASPPLGGMAFQGDGVCRDLKLQTKPDACF